jgi:hypothetical protein
MAARLRPAKMALAHESLLAGKTSAIRREAPPVAEDKQYGREASPGQGIGINREHGQLSFCCAA